MQTYQLKNLLTILCLLAITWSYAQNIPSPKEHFGFAIGDDYQLATYTQTEAYFKKLAATSSRVKLVDIGKTEEGRTQYMMVVSSPKNLENLEHYRQISQQLAHAENLTDEQAHALAAEGKAIVWIDGGLHANETVGAHQLIETAWQLGSRTDAETMKLLDNVIILMVHANPDGQELMSSWYMRETNPEKRSLLHLPRLFEKYAGHDNNRDFYMLNLKESQNMARQLYIEWIPQIIYNHHQPGPVGSVVAGPPYRDPFNYLFDPLVITGLDAMGAAMSTRLDAENKPGYTERAGSVYSTWFNGGLRTTTYFHNIIGLLTEIIGSPTPTTIPLVTSRLIPNSATVLPVTPRAWHFRQSIDYSVSLNYAVLDYATRYRDQLLYNIYRMGKNSIQNGGQDHWTLSPKRIAEMNQLAQSETKVTKKGALAPDSSADAEESSSSIATKYYDTVMKNPALRDARGYIIPANQPDFPTAIRFLNALIRTGVVVNKATSAFTVEGKSYPDGSYIIKTNQAFRPHVIDLFEPQDHPNDFLYPGGPPIKPYDAAGWTLAYQMGIQFDRILTPFEVTAERVPYGELQTLQGSIVATGSAKGYLLDARSNHSFTTANDLLEAGVEVYRLTDTIAGNKASLGSFYVAASPKAKAVIEKDAASLGITATTLAKRPSGLVKINPARIALWDIYGGSMPSGWMRYMMEQYHFPITRIYAKEIDTADLRSKYDVIIFPTGAIPSVGATGKGKAQPKPSIIPADLRPTLGRITAEKSIPALRKFLEAGGNIVTIGSSTNLAMHLGVPVKDALTEIINGEEKKLPGEKFYIPGTILRASIDSASPAAWGMNSKADMMFDESPVFKISTSAYANGSVKPIAWFATNKPLRSGWAWGQEYLLDGVAAFETKVGKGKLYAFGPEIIYRAQSYGTFKLLFNGLYK
ncbi:M14 metallopeptidase family protein [Parasediminibacterium sp. JCM 36343]|uniref:M14 family metallopeptidase n=1 Tax=Parasediminibacterium sp. JCM 36343 TaxID=3374279 RepID=UPI00397B756D